MATTTDEITTAEAVEEKLETFRYKKILFGLIKKREIVRTDSLGVDIQLVSNRPIRDIYFNGKKIK